MKVGFGKVPDRINKILQQDPNEGESKKHVYSWSLLIVVFRFVRGRGGGGAETQYVRTLHATAQLEPKCTDEETMWFLAKLQKYLQSILEAF